MFRFNIIFNDLSVISLRCVNSATGLYINFSDTQGQLTQQSVVKSSRNSNSYKLLWLSSLPARMKKIQSKMKALDANNISPIISPSIFSDAQGQLTPQSLVKLRRNSNSTEILWLSPYLQE